MKYTFEIAYNLNFYKEPHKKDTIDSIFVPKPSIVSQLYCRIIYYLRITNSRRAHIVPFATSFQISVTFFISGKKISQYKYLSLFKKYR